ncbi:LAFE_0D06194g1_1 [Lachancea fermentati]|uniref:assimilatory sulfite reductase (NADPH) n=1 Tax=Lachancea fermentati TaxID=4955 RepID=A0A1G4MB87_LACFM|nr:LAFE_0D06194g1_1 [Lachancea fermentati]
MSTDFVTNPFGLPTDWKQSAYTSPVAAISSVLFENVESLFSYKTFSEPDLLDAALKKWSQKSSNNSYFEELELRAAAGLAPLGYARSQGGLSGIITPGYGLKYFLNNFRREVQNNGRFLFNVGALDYDDDADQVVADYITPLNVASQLGFPVVTPLSPQESKYTTVLTLALAKFGKELGAIHLFDGPNYAKSVLKVDETTDKSLLETLSKNVLSGSSFTEILDKFNEISPKRLHNFEYLGDEDAEVIFVTYGSLESEIFTDALKNSSSKVGLISIRIPLPFDVERFVAQIPSTARQIVVIGQSLDGAKPSYLKSQVSAALFYQGKTKIRVSEYIYKPSFIWSPSAVEQIINSFVPECTTKEIRDAQGFIFWAIDNSANADLSARLVHALSLVDGRDVTLRSKFDNNANGGVFQAQFVSLPSDQSIAVSNIDSASVAIVENPSILGTFNVASTVNPNGTVLIISEVPLKDKVISDKDTLMKEFKIPSTFLKQVVDKDIQVIFLDAEAIGDKEETKGRTLSFVLQAAFWKYAYGLSIAESVRRIWSSAGSDIELLAAVLSETITNAFEVGIFKISNDDLRKSFSKKDQNDSDEKTEEEEPTLPLFLSETCFKPNPREAEDYPEVETSDPLQIAKQLTFSEAYDVKRDLRPDLPVKNFVVKVKENRRVTPADYDRYIFHIEFDISGTDLKYGIGEALGIHSRNNEERVLEFLSNYGLNANEVILVPSKENYQILEARTVLQAFTENLDIFGKPPKRFYESLADFAVEEKDKKKLEDLVSAAGAAELKRFQDVEYYSYVDIFNLFPSAKPQLEDLVKIIAPLKRREYSIASSQRVHPNEIHLLIVVVDWIDNQGRKRYGQCSKYLSELPVGSELVVSVKPSVMKLPPSPKQPVIMSGLGTGLAPFKAIVEEKLWQKQQGHEIGEVYLFLGSRHKREEYLYGELWEAYKDAGIITHIGAAFSRDQPQKIYIQDRIRESLADLKKAMIDNEGSFYLCGPTWPVPDITKALQDIIAADAEEKGIKVDLNAAIEDLKEASRYILEVY